MSDKCKGLTKAGNPCKGKPLPDSDYCMSHQIKDELCGHQNKHYTGDEPLFCDLAPKHPGPHSAVYRAVVYRDGQIESDGEERTHWSDAAGVIIE